MYHDGAGTTREADAVPHFDVTSRFRRRRRRFCRRCRRRRLCHHLPTCKCTHTSCLLQ